MASVSARCGEEGEVRRPEVDQSRASVAGLALLALVLGYFAAAHPGVKTAELRLNDGGVWVTNTALRLVGHLNYPSRTLDGGLSAFGDEVDVTQEARSILVADPTSGVAQSVDTARLVYGVKGEVPSGFALAHGGDTVAIVDSAGGRVWVMSLAQIGSFSPEGEPTVEGVRGVRVVVSRSGVVHAVAGDGGLMTVAPATGGWSVADVGRLPDYPGSDGIVLTLVGEEVVATDTAAKRMWTKDRALALPEAGLVLQQPGPPANSVALSGPSSLLAIPLDGSAPVRASVQRGRPAAPVVVGGCTYAAWSASGAYIRDCAGTTNDLSRTVRRLAKITSLVFRVNRDVVVINDTANGDIVLPNADFTTVTNWKDIEAQIESKDKGDEDSAETIDEVTTGKRSKNNHPPRALDDTFGVRSGRATKLPVLMNDSDPDGDILTAAVPKPGNLGPISTVRGGEALQITTNAESGRETIPYTVSDGRGGEDRASVTIEVHPDTVNEAPEQRRFPSVQVAERHEVSYNVLPDWLDPDGDDAMLVGVAEEPGLQVRTRPDGLMTIRDLGIKGPGTISLKVTVGDGKDVADGTVKIVVRSKDKNNPPVANADHARVPVGTDVVVKPLVNDTDAEGDELRLSAVGAAADARISKDLTAGTFSVSSPKPGTIYVPYEVTDGPDSAQGVVRVDVVEVEKKAKPVTDNDLGLLPDGGAVLVDVLANDDDPNGGVLVLRSAAATPDLGVAVEVIDHHLLRVTAPSGLSRPVSFPYDVSNGTGSATGQVTVIPLPPVAQPEPPAAKDDPAVVRAGDVVTVQVIKNDSSPAGLDLTVKPVVDVISKDDLGEFFVSENTVRFKAGAKRGRARATYTIEDSRGNFASADVIVAIRGLEEKNSPPAPKPLIARLVGGSQVSIAVPTDGIDPNGDSVTLLGIERPPSIGTVTVDQGKLVFRAPLGSAGTDSFTYSVADRFGAKSTAQVQVGIAPPAAGNQLPVAVTDAITARPSVELALPVTANDFDGDGDVVSLVAGSVKQVDDSTRAPARGESNRVWLTTPADEGVLGYYYDVTDGRGGVARGSLTVEVTKTAPLLPPVARDDIVDLADIIGKTSVEVDVLANDDDPDGVSEQLAVAAEEGGVTVAGGKLTVPVKTERQVLVYSVTDKDQLSGKAVVIVPGTGTDTPRNPDEPTDPPGPPPTVREDKIPVRIKAGERTTLALSEYVVVRDGHAPMLTYERSVQAGPGADGNDLVVNPTTLAFTADKEFGGDSGLTFEVTDGERADDPQGLKATLTIPIVVEAIKNSPPTFAPSQVTVEAGGEATNVDLRPMATDPDPADREKLSFSLGTVAGVDASLSGSTLSVSAPMDTPAGMSFLLPVTVSDHTNKPVAAKLPITVLATTKPLIATRDAQIEGDAGKPVSVDIADYVTNPFAAEGKPVTIVGRPIVGDGGSLTGIEGTTVTITPGSGFHGQLHVGYTVNDAAGRPERQVAGRILVTVRAAPDPPTGVVAETKASRTASVSWVPGANNGAPITGFTVHWAGDGTGEQDCGQVTSCTVTSLQNGREYRFFVVAHNDVGDSDSSQTSAPITPDVQPDPPAAPSATYGDRQISLSWPATTSEGSPVTSYTVEISPPAGGRSSQEVTGTSMVWDGLTNGTAYRFRLRAHSAAEDPSDWGPYSTDEIPAGPPLKPSAPTATPNGDKNLDPSATVKWSAPNGNGDNAMTYDVRLTGSTAILYSGTASSSNFNLSVSTAAQSFQVRASNKAGAGEWSEASNPVRAFKAPGAPTGVTAAATGSDNQVRLTFTPGALNGATAGEVSYFWSAGGTTGDIPSGGGTITSGAFPNGRDIGVSVYAVSTVDGVKAPGPASASATVNAYGPPRIPTVRAEGSVNNVTLFWDASASANGRQIEEVQIRTVEGTFTVGTSGPRDEGNGRNQERWIEAQVRAGGIWSGWSGRASARTWGDAYEVTTHGGGCSAWPGCRLVYVELVQWNPSSRVRCFVGGDGHGDWYRTIVVDSNGHAGPFTDGDDEMGYLGDSAGSPIADGRNTIDCRYS